LCEGQRQESNHLEFCLVYCCVLWCSPIKEALFWHMFWTCDVKGLLVYYKWKKGLSRWAWRWFLSKMPNLCYKKPSPRQKSWANGGKNGKLLANKQICLQKSWRPLWKPSLFQKLYCSRKHWSVHAPLQFVTVVNLCIYRLVFRLVQLGLL